MNPWEGDLADWCNRAQKGSGWYTRGWLPVDQSRERVPEMCEPGRPYRCTRCQTSKVASAPLRHAKGNLYIIADIDRETCKTTLSFYAYGPKFWFERTLKIEDDEDPTERLDNVYYDLLGDELLFMQSSTPTPYEFWNAQGYPAYLESDDWRVIRNAVLKRDDFKCVRCSATRKLQVHHLTYERIFREHPNDLVTLCAKCHAEVDPPKPRYLADDKLRFLIEEDEYSDEVKCPHCGGTYGVHLVRAKIRLGSVVATAFEDTVDVVPDASLKQTQRGSRIEITLGCEPCGKQSVVALQFHKGFVLAKVTADGKWADSDHKELWRD